MSRIRTVDFLPEIFKTSTNTQFLGATLDQLVNPPKTERLQGYVGSEFGYGVNAKDYYVTEPNKTRTDYQLSPGVAFLNNNQASAKDFLSYPELIDAIKLKGGVTLNNSRLFESQFYSWDSFTALDKLINFNQYYWIPAGPPVVTVASAIVFSETDYKVTDTASAYNVKLLGASSGTLNPTVTLLRGGTYRFAVDQETQFWIQGVPGTTGLSGAQDTRQVLGVNNNGATDGYVSFTVPARNAQDQFLFPGNNLVGVVSTALFADVNGKTLSELGSIDGVTSLENLSVMFYDTGEENEVGFVSSFFDESGANYDVNLTSPDLVPAVTLEITETVAGGTNKLITSGVTTDLVPNQTITFSSSAGAPLLGGLSLDTIYYVKSIVSATEFTVSLTLNGPAQTLTANTGTMIGNVNEGLFDEGFYTNVSENYYTITYVGDSSDPTIRLIPAGVIPSDEKITVSFGTAYIGLDFYRSLVGILLRVPYLSALLDTLYYQDGTFANKVGMIKLIDSNLTNTLDVTTDIIGQKTFTSTNGVVFTNGLKIQFDGDVSPTSYLTGEYYVAGVGEAIELVSTTDLTVPEDFTGTNYIPYDSLNYSIGNFDTELFIPVTPDYITIARDAINRNAWSRSNRWFHVDVINATATYNNDPTIITTYATGAAKAKRPIVEFYPNLKLFDSGSEAKAPVDFVDTRTTNAFDKVANQAQYYPDIESYTLYTATIAASSGATSTTITIATTDITSPLQVGQYITDSTNLLPINTTITTSVVSGDNTILTVGWSSPSTFASTTVASIVGSGTTVNNYALFSGARIVFASDTNLQVKNKIWVVGFSVISFGSPAVITLTESEDSPINADNQTVALRGFNYQGSTFWFDGLSWQEAQQKSTVNQAPLFDIYDKDGISFGDATIYQGTSFLGNKLFAYGVGVGTNDPILGFPVRYSDISNAGDISFDISLNVDIFSYVTGTTPVTAKVNTGYVYNYSDRTTKTRELGWQTAIAPSVQYQIFELEYNTGSTASFTCDVQVLADDVTITEKWPSAQVYINNVYQLPSAYTITSTATETTVTLNTAPTTDTPIQILLLSNQTSETAYYSIPINLSNNPFNADLEIADLGDIRSQYQDIFVNAPGTAGAVFGSNNYRDLGNLAPYGTKIIQNSAAVVLPSVFLRRSNHNLFDALQFNAHQYVQYKQQLVKTVNDIDWDQRFDPGYILDTALEKLTSAKSETGSFFWSDMLPSQAPHKSNIYTFANALQESIYPLSQTYDFTKANYNGVLVYLIRTVSGVTKTTQLVRNVDYTVSTSAPSLTVTEDLIAGDKITINEYTQTYGSFVPNTPSKLGMYPKWKPEVVLDSNYQTPTYMLRGHDGSYTSLYSLDYTPAVGLTDFRDQALLEFETRIYNNIKLSTVVPIQAYEVLPGFFRASTYSTEDYLKIYSSQFLNWAGQNRIDYKTQTGYTKTNQFSFNYSEQGNRLTETPITQGYWRGVYEYFYGTSQPNTAPWEMLGFSEIPSWWTAQYGPAPYTNQNGIMWTDIEAGLIYNGSTALSVTVPELKRTGLSKILPVDEHGTLLSPFDALLGNYDTNTFQKNWKVGDDAPAEFSYRRSASYPFDLMRIFALTKPADFFNLGADLDNYKYSTEFNQYLANDRSHLDISAISIYGDGTAKTSYINWIVDFEKQQGTDATTEITSQLRNVDVRLIYRLAGFSDKTLLKFFVEKATPNSDNASLLLPDESYNVLLHDNQPSGDLKYSSVVIQLVSNGWKVFGNSQSQAYFTIDQPITISNNRTIAVDNASVKVANAYTQTETKEKLIPYGTQFYTIQELAQFLASYGNWLTRKGMVFDSIDNGVEINWDIMIKEYLYWTQFNWENGSLITVNPSAQSLKIEKDSEIVQPLTIEQSNFLLNQNAYPIAIKDLAIERLDTKFEVKTLNSGDTMSYGQFNLSNMEHGIVFDNTTVFNDVLYNLITGLRQSRIYLRGSKTAEWNGTVFASGFILNQDNVVEWVPAMKYAKGTIVTYKAKYWTAIKTIEPSAVFAELDWVETDYDQIQKGLLPNSSTRSYESTLYYDSTKANLESDADQLSFSLIGFRPRDYLATINLTDITQVNVYKNLIKTKGTPNSISAFKGAKLATGGIDYDVFENWGILSGEFGGTLNNNFADFKLNETKLTGNPSIVSLTTGTPTIGSQQEVPLGNLFNYSRPITSPQILSTLGVESPLSLYPTAGFVNYNDVKMASYYYANLPTARNAEAIPVPINDFYVRDFVWLANFKENWRVYAWKPVGRVTAVTPNTDNTTTITFANPHGLSKLDPVSFINVSSTVNGYHIITRVNTLTEVTINLTLAEQPQNLAGNGIGLTFVDQRVAKPADINTMDLNEAEFTQNTVWVDEATDGQWGVYRKSINYDLTKNLNRADGQTFGSAVAYTARMGYLIGDSTAGKVYRYGYNTATKEFDLDVGSTLTGSLSFGSKIEYSGNLFVITEPDNGTSGLAQSKVRIYTLNDTVLSDDITLLQTITFAGNYADSIALSDDKEWLYIGDTTTSGRIRAYRRQHIPLLAGFFETTETYEITSVGTTDWKAIGALDNKVGIVFVATGVGSGTGTANQITYQALPTTIEGSTAPVSAITGDNFGYAISTDNNGDTISVSAPNKASPTAKSNWGSNYIYSRLVQNIETQYNAQPAQPYNFNQAWTTLHVARTANDVTSNVITFVGTAITADFTNRPVVFNVGGTYGDSGISPNQVYYMQYISAQSFSLKTTRSTIDVITLVDDATADFILYDQADSLHVSVNGTFVDDNNYASIGTIFRYFGSLIAGDIVTVGSNVFTWVQTMNSSLDERVGTQFGYDNAMTSFGSEILVGAPGEIRIAGEVQTDGSVYRYTNGGGKYGTVIGTGDCTLTADRKLLINGYLVQLVSGSTATEIASLINEYSITNVVASATVDNKLVISVTNTNLALINEKLLLQAPNTDTFGELGIPVYTNTQVITAPHNESRTLFGNTIEFNESDSVVISAPASTRYLGTTFDFIDDSNLDNDTLFDNNATRFVDTWDNAGAVYMYDYLANYNGSVANSGKFVYAQNINNTDQNYGFQPLYGTSLDFSDNKVVIGTPNLSYGDLEGQITVYENASGLKDWALHRQSSAVVDINKIQNAQIYSAETNDTLINLDYIDPMQGKLLGAVRENLDFVNNVDPAYYNAELGGVNAGLIWGIRQVGNLWFDTTNVRWLNYHQNDVEYNARHWGRVFPGSRVSVCTWVRSNVSPDRYTGPGTPRSLTQYSVEASLNASNTVIPTYYFWVLNTDTVMSAEGKTLSDTTLENYIRNPRLSGIAYFVPLLQNTFALYNTGEYVNNTDSVFHIGFATGNNDDPSHQEFNLIRANFSDDFLPGLPKFGVQTPSNSPRGLYDRLLDSLSGVDEIGEVVPNPYLPKAVQSGVLSRPRQSFFFSRFLGLENYLNYANTVLAQFPIAETRQDATYLSKTGTYYDTTTYWEYVNWWLPTTNPVGQYNNNTKSTASVAIYADLAALVVDAGTIVTVETNGNGKWEVYRFDGNGVWTRIGLENGTIKFKIYLWDYAAGKTGFGENFFDTDTYDDYPSEETRWIIRALNEQIYIDELVSFRNKSLIILFEYIQSETDESQNYLPWLTKTSLVDVSHVIRDLEPIQNYQGDNQDFLAGYINEAKPYHVVIKDFLFKYTGLDTWQGNVTDFDLPAEYQTSSLSYVSPQLVYQNANSNAQFLPIDPIWSSPQYTSWYNNYGVSITGIPDYQLTVLGEYMTLGSTFLFVDNAQGFPINGIIQIGTEIIGYSSVDRALNLLSGLQRGINGTTAVAHIPGAKVFMDLPAVIVLDGGKNYIEPPEITAYIDTTNYPEPRVLAQLEAVMSVGSVISVNVINPGEGYAVLPEIRIAPADQLFFANADINSTLHTIKLFAPNIMTGDLIQYKDAIAGAAVGKLVNDQWYYINVLETNPTTIVALYTNYNDAVTETSRVKLVAGTVDGDFALNIGAKASAITSSSPVRQNQLAMRFDRTTYKSQITDWETNVYYGSFFAGGYFNSENVSSSSISLQASQPPITSIAASAEGAIFEIADISNNQDILYTTFARRVTNTTATGNKITLNPYDEGTGAVNSSGSTIGFTVGMPIKFSGATIGNIIAGTVYYVKSVDSITEFTISATNGGTTFVVTDATAPLSGIDAFAGEVTDTAVLTLNYPGMLIVTATASTSNKITIPQSIIGTGGTDGFYPGIPLFFTGTTFGGILEDDVYYVTTVVDNETITLGASATSVSTTVLGTTTSTNVVTVSSTTGFAVNDAVIFNNMRNLSTNLVALSYGGIVSGTLYYVNEVVSDTELKIATQINAGVLALSDAFLIDAGSFTIGNTYQIVTVGTTIFTDIGAINNTVGTVFIATGVGAGTGVATSTTALLGNQKDTLDLTTATGAMTMNVSLPIAPGQVTGQQFTLYNTSSFYSDITTGVLSNTIDRACYATLEGDVGEGTNDRIALSSVDKGTVNFYVGMPLEFNTVPVGSGLATGTTYYVRDFSDSDDKTTYISVSCSNTSSSTNEITCLDTSSLWVNMPIIFSGIGLGNIIIGDQYYIKTIVNATRFTIATTPADSAYVLLTDNGAMTGTGSPWIRLNDISDAIIPISANTTTVFSLTQTPTTSAIVDMAFKLGGYRAILSNAGVGYAITNKITISGAEIGGTAPENDATLEVNTISSTGAITSLIVSGDPADKVTQYFLKITTANQLEVYSDARMTVPVSGIGFDFVGFTSTDVVETFEPSNKIELTDISGFAVNDEIVFMGTIPVDGGGNPYFASTTTTSYYIKTIDTADDTIQISLDPGGSVINVAVSSVSPITGLTIAKAGSYAFLPEPFYFNQSIVKYLNRVYRCTISNNDTEFVIGKWEELRSDDRVLNALDRVEGYYRPTVNMPGLDLTQLFSGVTYPNAVYLGNAFAPEDQYSIDTELKGQDFYPTGVSITSVLWDGTNYFASSNLSTYSGLLTSGAGTNWTIKQIASSVVGITDIVLGAGIYVMSSTNTATPIYRSSDGIIWTTNSSALTIPAVQLNSVAYRNNYFVAVGDEIVQSDDSYAWLSRKTYDTELAVTLYGVQSVDTSGFAGFIAVGKGKKKDYSTGLTELIDTNIIVYSYEATGEFWQDGPSLTPNGFNAVDSDGTIALVVGENNVVYQTNNGGSWTGVNEVSVVSVNSVTDQINSTSTAGFLNSDQIVFSDSFSSLTAGVVYYVKVISSTQVEIYSNVGLSTQITLIDDVIPLQCRMSLYDSTAQTLRDVIYADSIWMTVGDNGRIQTSADGLIWTTQTSGTTSDLNGINYNSDTDAFIVVGDDNTIIQSTDAGVTWISTSVFTVAEPIYDVKGADFSYGYGPEELVPGLIKDNLTMTVASRPGTVWDVTEYSHVGYNVVSNIMGPTTEFQVDYSFDQMVQYPINLSLQIIDATTGLGTTLAKSNYTINWLTKVITLDTALTFLPMQTLRIDVYEVGNGNQLVKGSTDTDAIRTVDETGFDDIYVNCNYSSTFFQGSGLIRTGSHAIETLATQTVADGDIIVCDSVTDFTINDDISFQGVVFGNIVGDTTYYVKSISTATSSITISESIVSGQAGPTFILVDATGSMIVNIDTGTGTVWTDPIVYHNGNKLVLGRTNSVSRTKASNNAITTGTTVGLVVGSRIYFAATMFGDVTPNTEYYVKAIIDGDEFTISETIGGPEATLIDASGVSAYVSNDYAIAQQPNGIQAKLVFGPPNSYTNETDYIVYSLFGESATATQYGYSVPEIQEFTGNGSSASFALTNYVGDNNITNAIVEVAGLRQTRSQYTISSGLNTILFNSPPAIGASISVLTYNDTMRQYLTSQYGISGIAGSAFTTITVTATTHTEGTFDQGVATLAGDFNIGTEYTIVSTGTTDFTLIGAANSTPGTVFEATGAGTGTGTARATLQAYNQGDLSSTAGNFVAGVTYTIVSTGTTDFTLIGAANSTPGTVFEATGIGAGTGTATSTTVAGDFNIGVTYIIVSTGTTDFTLIGAADSNPGTVFVATGIGIGTGTGTATITVTYDELLDTLTCTDTSVLTVDEPIVFSNPTIGGITAGITYYILEIIDATTFTVSLSIGGIQVTVTTDSGSMVGTSNAITVANISNIDTAVSAPLANTNATATAVTTNVITFTSTVGFVVDQTIFFTGTNFGNLEQGTIYFVDTVSLDGTTATIKDSGGTQVVLAPGSGNMLVEVGGSPTTRITTGIPHALANDILCTIDGTLGSVGLNGNSYYVKIIDATRFDIYTQVYNPGLDAVNYPVTGISTYVSGGYVWRQGTFFLTTTVASETSVTNDLITVASTADLVVNTPVIFTQQGQQAGATVLGGLIQGTTYYVKSIDVNGVDFSVGATRSATTTITLTNETGTMNVTQWEQTNVDRLWVTVNGYRLPNNKLKISSDNEVSLLTDIAPGDVVIMTNMIPYSTPNEEIYLNLVNASQEASIYRANVQTRTWLSASIEVLAQNVFVGDVTRVTNSIIQNVLAPTPVDSIYSIGLTSEKTILSSVVVLNTTTGVTLSSSTYSVEIENLAPILKITDGAYISVNDSLTITSIEGATMYINGEQINFASVDFDNNSVGGLQRGANGTAMQTVIPKYTEVFSLLSANKLSSVYYNQTWNSYEFNTIQGDPLQISNTVSAQFLQTDIT